MSGQALAPTVAARGTRRRASSHDDFTLNGTPADGGDVGAEVSAGRRLGRYEIVRRLGGGAMGTVYLARDPRLHREVALKVPTDAVAADPALRARFLREARAAATLHHPNLCPVFDAGEADGRPFLAMAHLPGPDLSRARPGPLDPRAAAALVRDLADGMAHAHARGVIHRDLKPANVLLDAAGRPSVADFGLARIAGPAGELGDDAGSTVTTNPGAVLGTPAYMAPELLAGDAAAAGPKSDIYALGVMLYELLTGRRPFDGPPSEYLRRALTEDPPPPSRLRPGVPGELDHAWRRMTARDPGDRFAAMGAVRDALDAYLARTAAEAPGTRVDTASTAVGAARPAPRARPPWIAAAVAAVVVAALGVVTIVYRDASGVMQTMTVEVPGEVVELSGDGGEAAAGGPGGGAAGGDTGGATAAADDAAGDWTDLFNGRDLAGWKVGEAGVWAVRDGVLTAEFPADAEGKLAKATQSELRHDRGLGDGVLRVVARVNGAVGSGVTVRNLPSGVGGRQTEVNLSPNDPGWHGSLWSKVWPGPGVEETPSESIKVPPDAAAALSEAAAVNGEPDGWDVVEIRTAGTTVAATVNGVPAVSADLPDLPPRGFVGLLLQRRYHTNIGRVEFRSVRWKPAENATSPGE